MWDVNRALKVNANVYHVYIACMLARFRELGMLKFGVIKGASEATGRCIAQYIAATHGPGFSSIEEALKQLNLVFTFSDEVRVRTYENILEVMFHKDSCRICPRNIGGLELPGPACPNVGFVKGYLEELGLVKLKESYNVEKGDLPVKHREGYCVISYEILEKNAKLMRAQPAGSG